ncbi:minor tail protein [Mycobacterium phage Reindeer]|uniref:Minor tail protein n=1 Tax=Mycobacterium phage Reindeer TaxID=2762283 RepID=A0A7G8LHW7_9CAUD|nr:minor tail protein [Mycobacterium phage Reindeer]QNJ56839.1 minor tail protein [Mycobacterium phage Reindeer]
MAYAELLDTDMGTWCPVTKHYRITDGSGVSYLAVTRVSFVTASGRVEAFACSENGMALSLSPVWTVEDMTHEDALAAKGIELREG